MPRRVAFLILTALIGSQGCHSCKRQDCVAQYPYCAQRYPDFPQPPRMTPAPQAAAPAQVPFVPPTNQPPPASLDRPVPAAPPTEGGSTELGMAPGAEASPPGVRLGPPGPIRRESASIAPDGSTKEPPLANVPGESPPRATESREPDKEAQAAIDLPGFTEVVPGVVNGLKPFTDGVDLLAKKGYRTVLHLRGPGEDTTAARNIFERKGLRYLSLEVSPKLLTKELYDQFAGYVKDKGLHPLYVWDKDGSSAGALWWLYFKVELGQNDEKALAEATRINPSFSEDRDSHKTMLLAAQRLLSTLKR
jgi:hypothetical protein